MNPVHDFSVYAFAFDCERRRLTLFTEAMHGDKTRIDVVFHDVFDHELTHVLPGNILFGVEECACEILIDEHQERFASNWQHGWRPHEYRGDLEVLKSLLREAGAKAFEISSSYGLCGWALAKRVEYVPRKKRAQLE